MKINKLVVGLALAAVAAVPQAAVAEGNINIGHLQCNVASGMGLVVTSSKEMKCEFVALGGAYRERYVGVIRKYGLDLGPTNQGVLIWDVIAPAGGPPRGSLTGEYIGGAASATVGVGLGANGLVAVAGAGNGRSITLQPLSTQAQTGLNVAAGVASMSLRSAGGVPGSVPHRGRHHRI